MRWHGRAGDYAGRGTARLPIHLVGVIPTAENSVSSTAYRPGDIVRFYNGKTAEITNTDAEGRLILADALAYVADKYDPAAIIDLATLTGGVVVALGGVYAGLFANNDPLAAALEAAGEASGELLWRLPLHERYKPLMEGYHADLVNSGPAAPIPCRARFSCSILFLRTCRGRIWISPAPLFPPRMIGI